jgi:hypothetical protein
MALLERRTDTMITELRDSLDTYRNRLDELGRFL